MSAAVRAEGVTKRFGAETALDGVSFEVEPGEIFGFIGPDGAGKTTLFRILTTLLLPDEGRATVLGRDVVADVWAIRPRLGYMPGRFSLYPDLSVEENLVFFASVFGTTLANERARIAPIYDQIARFRKRRAGALSGGMKQKLALCCALVHRPEVLLLDEPTTGVDAVSRREFWDLLAGLDKSALTVIVSTPYMDEAARCDRVALMQQGRTLMIDAPSSIIAAFGRPLLAVRARERHRLLRELRALPHARTVFPFGESVHYTDRRDGLLADTIAAELREALRSSGFEDASVEETSATIEDCFMESVR